MITRKFQATICRVKGGYGNIWPTKSWAETRLFYTGEHTHYNVGYGRSE